MTISIEFADGKGGRTAGTDLATNRGWAEFGAWVDGLPDNNSAYDGVIILYEHGLLYDLPSLIAAIEAALKDHPPAKNVRAVAENLLALARRNSSVQGMFVVDDS